MEEEILQSSSLCHIFDLEWKSSHSYSSLSPHSFLFLLFIFHIQTLLGPKFFGQQAEEC